MKDALDISTDVYPQSHWSCSYAAKELHPNHLNVLSDWGEESSTQLCSFKGDGYSMVFRVTNLGVRDDEICYRTTLANLVDYLSKYVVLIIVIASFFCKI
ncbi:MAG: hypothetical protein ACI9LE_001694 [Paraglaciecola sp.]|jgi:hypothetical protein